ncbi:MAG: hypothetical protein SGJ20_03980 [Planctomycetota bacterium]|nr:hypothetical protein [Planctomycetota bacterium]
MKRTISVEDHKLNAAFAVLQETFREARLADRLDKPLAFWALPTDRRLPMALLGHTLRQLLNSDLDDLASTPGIGRKKLNSLIKLLSRATKEQSQALPGENEPASNGKKRGRKGEGGFDPSTVSEVIWEQWQQSVRRAGAGKEPLGRLAPTLQHLPTVIWHTPLEVYFDQTLASIRRLKTHGEKRVRAILEVFYSVHSMFAAAPAGGHLHFRMSPRFTVPIEQWIERALQRTQRISKEDIRDHIAVPLLEQLKIDTSPVIHRLSEERLGVRSEPHRVQNQANRLGVTRARVYQLLETCAEVMKVRWPEGRALLTKLLKHLESSDKPAGAEALKPVIELFFPEDAAAEVLKPATKTASKRKILNVAAKGRKTGRSVAKR